MPKSDSEQFVDRAGEVLDIRAAIALLEWDQETYMPPKGAEARGRQLATLSALAHRLFTAPELGRLLDSLKGEKSLDPDQKRTIDETRYDYDRATRLPESFVQELAKEQSKGFNAWVEARKQSDFGLFMPQLARLVDLLRKMADYLGYEDTPYDALLEQYERGMTTRQLRAIFATLAHKQSDLVRRIAQSPVQPDSSWIGERQWDEDSQWNLCLRILGDMGYDFDAGRQDKSPHPFTTNFDICDVRVTTRIDLQNPFSALLGSIHEGGHALYEQGFQMEDRRTILAAAPSLGIHESQSRLWENLIGRGLPFWKHYAPVMAGLFADSKDEITAERVYGAINCVKPSLIRVEADECTYNLHIILRFELEVGLIEGRINVEDVPDVWNAKVKEYLGIEVPDAARGCLQDVHWSHGAMGYFPTYALGNLYAAQLFEKVRQDIPELDSEVAQGYFGSLLEWLREHVHRFGRRKMATEIVRDATGREPSPEPFLQYLETKFGSLYDLDVWHAAPETGATRG